MSYNGINKQRYFITDDSHIGKLMVGAINPQEMLLIIGKMVFENKGITQICDFLETHYFFECEADGISFAELNTDDTYPYTYYDLITERVAEEEGYLYSNITEIKKYYTESGSVDILLSLDFDNITHRYFS